MCQSIARFRWGERYSSTVESSAIGWSSLCPTGTTSYRKTNDPAKHARAEIQHDPCSADPANMTQPKYNIDLQTLRQLCTLDFYIAQTSAEDPQRSLYTQKTAFSQQRMLSTATIVTAQKLPMITGAQNQKSEVQFAAQANFVIQSLWKDETPFLPLVLSHQPRGEPKPNHSAGLLAQTLQVAEAQIMPLVLLI